MYEQTNTMMETKTLFQIPQLLDGDDFTSEDLADDMEGLRLSFTRIKIPGGGHLQFEIPSGNPDVPDYAPYLEGVILYSHNSNAYWPEGSEYDDDQPPLCQSFDGKVGYGEPGGTCADCVLNQFGSDGNNKGKACKNMRMLYLLRSGEYAGISCRERFEPCAECLCLSCVRHGRSPAGCREEGTPHKRMVRREAAPSCGA